MPEEKENQEDNKNNKSTINKIKNVTIDLLVWVFGIFMLLSGIIFIFESFIAGILGILIGCIVLPPIINLIESSLNFSFSFGIKAIIVIVLFGFMMSVIPEQEIKDTKSNQGENRTKVAEESDARDSKESLEEDSAEGEIDEADKSDETQEKNNEKAQEYFLELADISNDITEGMSYITKISRNKPNPASWTYEEISDAAYYSVLIESAYDKAKEITPPKEYEYGHSLFLKGLKKYQEAMPIWRSGIDNFNVSKIERAASLIEEGNNYINKASQELEKFNLEL